MKNTSLLLTLVAGSLCFAGLSTNSLAAPHYVAHEWGTFTSVQGADGVQLSWNPLSVSDLPGFVHDWPKSGPAHQRANRKGLVNKLTSMSLQRMETPVIYFYADAPMSVNVRVNFPQGMMTEWYPQANWPSRSTDADLTGPKSLAWDNVQVFPADSQATKTSEPITILPSSKEPSHYFAARETGADLVRVNGETEKFLFYRGVGDFRAPLTVTQAGPDGQTIALRNSGPEELRHLFIYDVGAEGGRFVRLAKLDPGAQAQVRISDAGAVVPTSVVREGLGQAMAEALKSEGLYEPEARAMVKTWDDSWFGEKGLRVLYVLSGQWTDRVLPLTLEPKPAQVVRVMVGRAELITPRMETDLQREIVRYGQGDAAAKAQAVEAVRELGLGRFLEPTIRRLAMRAAGDKSFEIQSAALLRAATQKPTGGRLAAK